MQITTYICILSTYVCCKKEENLGPCSNYVYMSFYADCQLKTIQLGVQETCEMNEAFENKLMFYHPKTRRFAAS